MIINQKPSISRGSEHKEGPEAFCFKHYSLPYVLRWSRYINFPAIPEEDGWHLVVISPATLSCPGLACRVFVTYLDSTCAPRKNEY